MKVKDIILEAANPAQQAAIAIAKKDEMDEAKQRLDPKCWTGKHKEGTKMKGGIRVNNCVPNESVEEASNSTVDMTGKKCEKCKKGTYQETGMHDDMDGVLHCTKCGTEVKRHPQRHRNIKAKARHESVDEDLSLEEQFDIIEEMVEELALHYGVDSEEIWEHFESVDDDELFEAAAWQKKSGKNKNGGLNKKGVASYRKEHPGSKLQTAVTTKPSKLKKGSKAAKRRTSFCARMKGMKKHRAGAKTKRDPNSRINKALRKWHC